MYPVLFLVSQFGDAEITTSVSPADPSVCETSIQFIGVYVLQLASAVNFIRYDPPLRGKSILSVSPLIAAVCCVTSKVLVIAPARFTNIVREYPYVFPVTFMSKYVLSSAPIALHQSPPLTEILQSVLESTYTLYVPAVLGIYSAPSENSIYGVAAFCSALIVVV